MRDERIRHESATSAPSIVRFGPYELDLRTAELRKNDLKISLQDQPFQILVALLEHPGEVVLREELRRRLWGNETVVEFDHGINFNFNSFVFIHYYFLSSVKTRFFIWVQDLDSSCFCIRFQKT